MRARARHAVPLHFQAVNRSVATQRAVPNGGQRSLLRAGGPRDMPRPKSALDGVPATPGKNFVLWVADGRGVVRTTTDLVKGCAVV